MSKFYVNNRLVTIEEFVAAIGTKVELHFLKENDEEYLSIFSPAEDDEKENILSVDEFCRKALNSINTKDYASITELRDYLNNYEMEYEEYQVNYMADCLMGKF